MTTSDAARSRPDAGSPQRDESWTRACGKRRARLGAPGSGEKRDGEDRQ